MAEGKRGIAGWISCKYLFARLGRWGLAEAWTKGDNDDPTAPSEDMTLAGLAPVSQALYVKSVYRLTAHYRWSPDQLSEEEVRSYLLGLRDRGVPRSGIHVKIP